MLTEYAIATDLSDVAAARALRGVLDAAAEHLILTNDLFSYAKEREAGDGMNAVAVLAAERGAGLPRVLALLRAAIEARERAFVCARTAALDGPLVRGTTSGPLSRRSATCCPGTCAGRRPRRATPAPMPADAAVPTAPGRVPGLGHVGALRRRPVDYMLALRGQGDLVRVYLGRMPIYVVNAPALIRQMLVTDRRCYDKGRLFDKTRPVLGDGLVTSNGALHRAQRQRVAPAFRAERIARYGEHMTELVGARLDTWEPGRVMALDRVLRSLTLAAVSRTLFASAIGREAAATVERELPVVVAGFIRRTVTPATLLERFPTPANRRFDAASGALRDVIDGVVRAYREDPVDHGDLLSMLVRAHGADDRMSDVRLRDELITMLLAGTDTTAVTLAWVFHELGRHPEVERRLHAELDAGELDLCRRVITEALRRRTPPWIVMRRAAEDVELGGVALPAGTELAFSPAALHRDPAYFRDPLRFDPDRWRGDGPDAARDAFIPFGMGDRRCIGDGYAMLEMTIVVAAVAARFRMRPAPGYAVRERAATVLAPSALPMIPVPRAAPVTAGRRPR